MPVIYNNEIKPPPPAPPKLDQFEAPSADPPSEGASAGVVIVGGLVVALLAWKLFG